MVVGHTLESLVNYRAGGRQFSLSCAGSPLESEENRRKFANEKQRRIPRTPSFKNIGKRAFWKKGQIQTKRNHGSWLLRVSEWIWKWLRRVKETEFPSYAIGFTQRSCPTNDIGHQCFLNYKKSESSLSQSGMVCPAPPWNSRVQKFLALSVSHSFCLSEQKTLGERNYHSCEGKQKLAEVKYSRKLIKSHANPILKACHCSVTPVSFRRWLVPHLSFPNWKHYSWWL